MLKTEFDFKSAQQHRLATQTGITGQINREGNSAYVSLLTCVQNINVIRNTGNSAGALDRSAASVICVAFVKHVQKQQSVCLYDSGSSFIPMV